MSWEIEFLIWLQEVIPFKEFFAVITHLGDKGILWIGIGIYLLFIKKDRLQGKRLFLALILMLVSVNLILKPMVMRIRPFDVYPIDLLIEAPHDYSFPSGHTAVSFAAAYVLGKDYKKYRGFFYCLALIIGFSRLVLFVHYPTDVLMGMLIGLACGYVATRCLKIETKS